ncbi:MAG: MoxR family ATPase [Clostridiales Family XIII bacterium]|jgi:MoxR-like ATPase|nr:MoxR family ATPase [Clostridiales Family XIII bacterium]
MRDALQRVLQEIRKVIVGKNEVVAEVLTAVLASGHVLLEDVPGVGKTTMTLAFAKALGLEAKRVQFTSDTMPADIIGFSVYDRRIEDFAYKPGAIMTNMLLADEINRTSSKTQSALLEAMEEGSVTVDGVTHPLPAPFVVLATQNPVGSAGTQLLPASQLDRFLIRISIGYPDFESQVNILKDRRESNPLSEVEPVLTRARLIEIIEAVARVHVGDTIYAYITSLAEASRAHPLVQLGVSPRGALALCRMAKGRAFLAGRDYVVPEDVAAVFPDVGGHRLVLNAKARFNELDGRAVVLEILEKLRMPVIEEIK